jgi:pimeloyl-ACP methyl ester carboxylesterase
MPGQFLQYNYTKIHYRVYGTGKPVVLLHGFGEDGNIWKHQVKALQDKYMLIIPDLPGSGQSGMIEDNSFELKTGMEIYAQAAKALLDQLNIKTCSMIGHSMGGYITLAFAEKYPEMLEKFGLFHSSAFADNEEKIKTRTKAIEFIEANGAYAFLKTSIPGLFAEKFRTEFPAQVDALVAAGSKFSDRAIIQYYRAMINRPDRTQVFKNFRNPVLFIIGEKDMAIPLEQSIKQCYQPFISDVHLLPGVAHMGMLEEVANCNEILHEFLLL